MGVATIYFLDPNSGGTGVVTGNSPAEVIVQLLKTQPCLFTPRELAEVANAADAALPPGQPAGASTLGQWVMTQVDATATSGPCVTATFVPMPAGTATDPAITDDEPPPFVVTQRPPS